MSSKFRGKFYPSTDTTGLQSVRRQLQVCFLSTSSTFMIRQHMKKVFQGSSVQESLGNHNLK